MSGEAVNQLQCQDAESDLDWSMSEISAASGFDPSQHTREVSSVSTPDIALPIGRDELDKLIQNVQGLRSSLASISEKTVTPVNSPRASMGNGEDQNTPTNVLKKSVPITPPVKDPGPGNASQGSARLEEMRQALKSLEEARSQLKPRKSLDFSSLSSLNVPTPGSNQAKPLNSMGRDQLKLETKCEQTEKMLLLEKEGQLHVLTVENHRLREESQKLQGQIDTQNKDIVKLEQEVNAKHKLLSEVKLTWEQAVHNLALEREKMLSEKSDIENDLCRMKSKEKETMEQFSLCQNELERALLLAADFKQKLDEDDHVRQCLQEQLNAAQETSRKLQLQLKQFQSKEGELIASQESLTNDVQRMKRKVEDATNDKEHYEQVMAREREQMKSEREHLYLEATAKQKSLEEKMKIELQVRLKANEESVHAFYLTQMESLLSEKVASLQEYINEWEKKLLAEKAEAVQQLKSEHSKQLESLRKHFSQLEAQMQASDEVHRASKREAEILKGQLQLSVNHSSQAETEDDEDIMSASAALNNRQRPQKSLSSSMAVNCHRINNLRDRPQTSAGGKAKVSLPEL